MIEWLVRLLRLPVELLSLYRWEPFGWDDEDYEEDA